MATILSNAQVRSPTDLRLKIRTGRIRGRSARERRDRSDVVKLRTTEHSLIRSGNDYRPDPLTFVAEGAWGLFSVCLPATGSALREAGVM